MLILRYGDHWLNLTRKHPLTPAKQTRDRILVDDTPGHVRSQRASQRLPVIIVLVGSSYDVVCCGKLHRRALVEALAHGVDDGGEVCSHWVTRLDAGLALPRVRLAAPDQTTAHQRVERLEPRP